MVAGGWAPILTINPGNVLAVSFDGLAASVLGLSIFEG